MDYPSYFAKFYDIIYSRMRSGVDKDYYLNKISSVNGPVLEIGVGTGRFFLEAIHQGADMYGIDVSKSMVNVLLEKLDGEYHNRISIQDAKDFKFDKQFDLIIAPFRVFSHILEINDQLAALNNIFDHLSNNGRLIFDLFVPDLEVLASGITNLVDFKGEYEPGKRFSRTINMTADLVHQISDITMTFKWDESGKERVEDWNFKFRFYFRYEIEHLIKRSKLTLDTIYGDYNGNILGPASREFVVVCKK